MSDYEVRNPKVEEVLKRLGHTIGDEMPDKYGFALFIFSIDDKNEFFYLSSAERESMIAALQEFIQKFRKN